VRNLVREQRGRIGLTQAELAETLDVSRQTVISIENGRYLPSLPLAFRLAGVFGVPLEELFQATEEDNHR